MRGALVLAASALAVVIGCAPTAAPDPSAALARLKAWRADGQLGRDGSVVTASYEGWPLSTAPRVFACAEAPDAVFAGREAAILVIEADPNCREFTTRLDGGRLRLSLDQTGLPASFATLDSWHTAWAVILGEATWSMESGLPVEFPIPVPPAS